MQAQKESIPGRVPARSLLLVVAQLVLLAGLLVTGPWWPANPLVRALVAAGVALGLWAVLTMRWRYLRATPEPAAGARLLTRHFPDYPAYASRTRRLIPGLW